MKNAVVPAAPLLPLFSPAAEISELIACAALHVAALPAELGNANAPDAQELLSDIVKLGGMIDKDRTKAKAPYLEAGKAIDAAAKVFSAPLAKLENEVRQKLTDYKFEIERQRAAAFNVQRQAELKAEKEAGDRTPALAATAAVAIPEAMGVKTRKYQVLKIDANKLPDMYWIPDEMSIRAALAKGEVVPGARFVTEERVVA